MAFFLKVHSFESGIFYFVLYEIFQAPH